MPARWALCLVLGGGCAFEAPVVAPLEPAEEAPYARADALFAAGRCGEAIAEYTTVLRRPLEQHEAARVKLMRALARLDCESTASPQLAFDELRAIERDYPTTVWGSTARFFVDDILRREALRQTIMRLRESEAALSGRISELETELESATGDKASLQSQVGALREDRRKLQATLDEATAAEVALRARVTDLTQQLADLKRIDMEREP